MKHEQPGTYWKPEEIPWMRREKEHRRKEAWWAVISWISSYINVVGTWAMLIMVIVVLTMLFL